MTRRNSIYILQLHSEILSTYTTLLHTHKFLTRMVGISISAKFPSYSTFNRKLNDVGDVMEIKTTLGTFKISHCPILLRVEPEASGET